MFDHKLIKGVELFKMMKNNPNIRDSIFGVIRRFIDFTLQGRYNPLTMQFETLTPRGEHNKLFLVLQVAEYMEEPLPEHHYDPYDSSAIMVNHVQSLYQAVLGHNGEVATFIHYCPTLAQNVYSIADYIYEEFYRHSRKDFSRRTVWDSYDHYENGDFVISSHIPVE